MTTQTTPEQLNSVSAEATVSSPAPNSTLSLEEGDAIYRSCRKLAVELIDMSIGTHPDNVADALFDFVATIIDKDLIRRRRDV